MGSHVPFQAPAAPERRSELVSDYVAGRLDESAAAIIGLAAEFDPRLSALIAEHADSRRRVHQRLSRSANHKENGAAF